MKLHELLNEAKKMTVYHGTSKSSADNMVKVGWTPNKYGPTGNNGKSKYLYVSTMFDDALWFANEIGDSTVVKIKCYQNDLYPDPDDEGGFTKEELLKRKELPAKFIIKIPIAPHNIKIDSKNINESKFDIEVINRLIKKYDHV